MELAVILGLTGAGAILAYIAMNVELEILAGDEMRFKHTPLKWMFMFMAVVDGVLVNVFSIYAITSNNIDMADIAGYMGQEVLMAHIGFTLLILGYFLLTLLSGIIGSWTTPSYAQRDRDR